MYWVKRTVVPEGLSFAMKTSVPLVDDEAVAPVTYALPAESTAIPLGSAAPVPAPKYVEYTRAPDGLSLLTNPPELLSVEDAPEVVGKSVDVVLPVTYALPAESTATPSA